MNTEAPDTVNLSSQQVAQASAAALSFLRMKTTLVPGDIRRQLDVLEVVLTGLASGNLVVASPSQLAVELEPEKKIQDPDDDGSGEDTKTPQAETEKGRESARREFPKETTSLAPADSLARSDEGASGAERTGSGSKG